MREMVSVTIPTYNERESVGPVLEKLLFLKWCPKVLLSVLRMG
jgi:glycosyltransferase involved in cell wall biosynthesis